MSPTSRSLALLRSRGYTAEVVERWIPRVNIRKDFLGCFDILAIHPDVPGVLGVQTTSGSNAAARIKKLQASPNLALWVHAGCEAVVHGWALRGPRGKRKTWTVAETPVVP